MARRLSLLIAVVLLLAAPAGGVHAGTDAKPLGPLNIKNSHPMFLTIGTQRVLSAVPASALELNLTYSSTYQLTRSASWDVAIDLEAAVAEFRYRRLLGTSTELSVEIPVVSYNGGFMDGAVAEFHSAFGFPDYSRSSRPHNDFLFEVRRDGQVVMEGRAGEIAPGDIRLGLKEALYCADPCISLYGFVELPTGEAAAGYGSGSLDTGVSVLVNKEVSSTVMAYLNAGVVSPGDLKADETIGLRAFYWAGAAAEWAATKRLRLNAELTVSSSPYEGTGITETDGLATLLSFGGRFIMSEFSAIEVSFSEDPSTTGAPDFMAGVGVVIRR